MGLIAETRDTILNLGRLKTETVEIDGTAVIITELGAVDNNRLFTDPTFQDQANQAMDMNKFGPALLACCIVDPDGDRLFTDSEAGKIGALKPAVYQQLLRVALDINGLSQGAQEAEIKNSAPSLGDSSVSD